ncbi:Ataxin-10 [Coemansia javaensis]|uniref:Ataxin-10 homolog n=1 Tax=Coemansia javaensis TaxID=2761396 RepID=A0A9W8LJM4_9FUNG|nr:Ataxin-10 [Coemansia javaensis]
MSRMDAASASVERLRALQQECAAYRGASPHPSRPHIAADVDRPVWDRIHALMQELVLRISAGARGEDNSDDDDDDDDALLAEIGGCAEALGDLCAFARNAAAAGPRNQEAIADSGVMADMASVARQMVRRELGCAAAARCAAAAGQALSNTVTGDARLRRRLMDAELLAGQEPTESVYWCLLVSTSAKTSTAGAVLLLNSVKDDAALCSALCSADAGRAVAHKVGELFGDSADDEAEHKTLLYVVLEALIAHRCYGALLAGGAQLGAYGLLDALAVHCKQSTGPSGYAALLDAALLGALNAVLAACRDVLARAWQGAAGAVDTEDLVAVQRSLAAALAALGEATVDMDAALSARVLEAGLVRTAVALLGLLSQHLPRARAAGGAEPASRAFAFKRDLIRVIGNAAHRNPPAQDLVRELGGLEMVLDNMQIDDSHPFIREHAVVALRCLLQDNAASQEYVQGMGAVGVVQDPQVARAGLQARIGPDGRVVVERAEQE